MNNSCTIQELRGALGGDGSGLVAEIKSLGFRLISDKHNQIGVVLRQDQKDVEDLLELPSYPNTYNYAFLID